MTIQTAPHTISALVLVEVWTRVHSCANPTGANHSITTADKLLLCVKIILWRKKMNKPIRMNIPVIVFSFSMHEIKSSKWMWPSLLLYLMSRTFAVLPVTFTPKTEYIQSKWQWSCDILQYLELETRGKDKSLRQNHNCFFPSCTCLSLRWQGYKIYLSFLLFVLDKVFMLESLHCFFLIYIWVGSINGLYSTCVCNKICYFVIKT